MMLGVATPEVELTSVNVANLKGDLQLSVEVTRVEKPKLLELDNPKYNDTVESYTHLKGVEMDDSDTKTMLPVYLILGVSEFAKIKTTQAPRVGSPGGPVAEMTRFGWTIMFLRKEPDLTKILLTQTSQVDYEKLCQLDVLGLQDPPLGDQEQVHLEFKEQLTRSPEGWYETGLPWRGNHPSLPKKEAGSLKRLESMIQKLEKNSILEKYDAIIKDQLDEGIVERVTGPPVGVEFYIPHKAVVREAAESTKLRIVYDASARGFREGSISQRVPSCGTSIAEQALGGVGASTFSPSRFDR